MQESALILSEYEDINSLLLKPIAATQRIKYTCINVSTNYIVLGSTSGSIYLFIRESCVFQQLMPLSEGPVTHILISPDEKTVALSSKRGSVCVVSIKPVFKLLSISNEHIGEIITCLCWNSKSSEIYVGDNNGKISTIILSIFTVNGMFQAPSCALMHLDSSIVQMDYYLHYLLVSTLTRCYICDTTHEQFKQIGNKIRDGEFGGCFFKTSTELDKNSEKASDDDKTHNKSIGLNSIMGLNDDINHDQSLKIYCARPGCRLWEVNIHGTVLKTHQFREALSATPTSTFKSSMIKTFNNTEKSDENFSSMQTFNFSRLNVISKKYLLSYTTNNLYIIDPINTNIILWTDEFSNIFIINVIDDKIYLMTVLGTFHCLLLSSIDILILKLFECKLYNDCLRACTIFSSHLKKIITNNEVLLNIDKLNKIDWNNTESSEIINTLQPIISVIQLNINTPQRLHSGIMLINSGPGKLRTEDSRSLNSTAENSISSINDMKNGKNHESDNESSDSEIIYKNLKKNINDMTMNQRGSHENGVKQITHSLSQVELSDYKTEQNLLTNDYQKYQESQSKEIETAMSTIQSNLEPLYILIGTLKSSQTIEEIEKIIDRVTKTINDINSKYENITQLKHFIYEIIRSFERHYFFTLLENISINLVSTNINNCILNEMMKAFVDLNSSNYLECTCGYPRAIEQCHEPKFFKVGKFLIETLIKIDKNKCILLCKNVPYMWREYLMIYIDNENVLEDDIIPLCLLTTDNIILSLLIYLLDDNQWNIFIEYIKKLERGHCLNCNRRFEILNTNNTDLINWSGVTHEIMKKRGLDNAMTFLRRLEKSLPHIKLKQDLYQSFIFTKLLGRYGLEHTVEFGEHKLDSKYGSICSTEAQKLLVEALEKDLERPVKKAIFGSGVFHWGMLYKLKVSYCSSCTLSLQTPVLLGNNGISIFPCGHAYHVNCVLQKKITKCFLHS
ncbi:Hermansky-Pudlak syndrome 5 protein homolog [Chelonus insularis]|uniref:Hermansky-Pudlak syndrome 5 protein homolog n=1 Tax=Chelonus insularis TaxID=460826 RepID=UPI00158C9076|nr:Hermansky-Pudlak syndrome 5 protein homolog [Chelonus insularis]